MKIKQIAIDEALELHKRGLMVGVLQPVVPEPKNLDDYEFLTLKKILAGCEFFRIVPEEEKRETESKAVEEKAVMKTKEKPEPPKSEAPNKKQIDVKCIDCGTAIKTEWDVAKKCYRTVKEED